jgi:NADH-quinone oxidoreductase subunit C
MSRDASKNAETKTDPEHSHETLKFFFTPVDAPRPGADKNKNPHAKGTTWVPDVVDALKARFGGDVLEVAEYANEHSVTVRKEQIVEVCRFLKAEQGFTYLADLGGGDLFTEEDRFEVVYNLVNIQGGKRIRIKIRVDEDDLVVPSVTPVYRAANWNEREAIDMFGIRFEGNPDPRRIYMPEDFEYYPLRKEFPLLGIPGSLPLPPQTPEGPLTLDPFPAAHGSKPVKSYEEPAQDGEDVSRH